MGYKLASDEYDVIRIFHYSNASVFLLCFSLVDSLSLESVTKQWVPEVRQYCPGVPILLVGTKSDIRDQPNANDLFFYEPISSDRGQEKANEIGASSYIEYSSKNGYNVNETFQLAVECFMKGKKSKTDKPRNHKKEVCKIF